MTVQPPPPRHNLPLGQAHQSVRSDQLVLIRTGLDWKITHENLISSLWPREMVVIGDRYI